mmetsp:Transcript_18390/g.25489  ORF Transcript_18390/g.25489 Transcript_18390/m.25489 type:complete len:240 (+) Transcript_18390:1417-2136(+)
MVRAGAATAGGGGRQLGCLQGRQVIHGDDDCGAEEEGQGQEPQRGGGQHHCSAGVCHGCGCRVRGGSLGEAWGRLRCRSLHLQAAIHPIYGGRHPPGQMHAGIHHPDAADPSAELPHLRLLPLSAVPGRGAVRGGADDRFWSPPHGRLASLLLRSAGQRALARPANHLALPPGHLTLHCRAAPHPPLLHGVLHLAGQVLFIGGGAGGLFAPGVGRPSASAAPQPRRHAAPPGALHAHAH